jgi:hypothetical protein
MRRNCSIKSPSATETTMIIAIDFDGTFTVDPRTWRSVIRTLVDAGHTVICATARTQSNANDHDLSEATGVKVVCCGVEVCKRVACARAGYNVAVWIDDCPEAIDRAIYKRR